VNAQNLFLTTRMSPYNNRKFKLVQGNLTFLQYL